MGNGEDRIAYLESLISRDPRGVKRIHGSDEAQFDGVIKRPCHWLVLRLCCAVREAKIVPGTHPAEDIGLSRCREKLWVSVLIAQMFL